MFVFEDKNVFFFFRIKVFVKESRPNNAESKMRQNDVLEVRYSQSSLSRFRLSRITAYLEEKNLVLIQKSKIRLQNIVEKRRNCSWEAISPLFHNIFNIYF